jgi:hypothetical protein
MLVEIRTNEPVEDGTFGESEIRDVEDQKSTTFVITLGRMKLRLLAPFAEAAYPINCRHGSQLKDLGYKRVVITVEVEK